MSSEVKLQRSRTGIEDQTVSDKSRVLEAVQRAINSVNQQRASDEMIGTSLETLLVGESSTLDSLSLISLLVAVEQEIDKEFGVELSLSEEEDLFSGEDNPLRSVSSFVEHISAKLRS